MNIKTMDMMIQRLMMMLSGSTMFSVSFSRS